MEISYRAIQNMADLRQVFQLQQLIWGENSQSLIPPHELYSLVTAGCPLIGAFERDLLVGFSVGFFGLAHLNSSRPAMANLKLASKRMAVHPDYRSQGIALHLKTEQYHFAKSQGLQLITWTFDPLISRNAYLYLHKLGAVVTQFVPDYYDDLMGQLNAIPGTDRMICEWWVGSKRAEERLFGQRKSLSLHDYLLGGLPIVNLPLYNEHGQPIPTERPLPLGQHAILLMEIPSQNDLLAQFPELGIAWREHTRHTFDQLFGAGYIVTDFLHDLYEHRQRSFYVFSYEGGQ
jgi:predicted GNAT superfamily acetyltransferase